MDEKNLIKKLINSEELYKNRFGVENRGVYSSENELVLDLFGNNSRIDLTIGYKIMGFGQCNDLFGWMEKLEGLTIELINHKTKQDIIFSNLFSYKYFQIFNFPILPLSFPKRELRLFDRTNNQFNSQTTSKTLNLLNQKKYRDMLSIIRNQEKILKYKPDEIAKNYLNQAKLV